MKQTRNLLILSALGGLATTGAFAAFDTLSVFGDAAGTTPAPSASNNFGPGGPTTSLTSGGADFWGTSDIGAVFFYDSAGTNKTTTDFTATVRHVNTTNPAPEWGRDGIIVRATAGQTVVGTPQANDPTFMSFRKSNGAIETGIRPTRGVDYTETLTSGNPTFLGPSVATTSYWLGAAREGSILHVSSAMNVGSEAAPVVGRWVQSATHTAAAGTPFSAGTEVIVGLGHHAHGLPRVNTATFANWNYAGSYNAARFGPAAGVGGATAWSVGGALNVTANGGAVRGRSFTQVAAVATGEATKWTVRATKTDSPFVPAYGSANAVRRTTAMEVADIVGTTTLAVPVTSAFRRSAGNPGLTADLYLAGNTGNLAGNQAIIAGAKQGTTVIPNVNWTGGGTTATQYYQGTPSDFRNAIRAGPPANPASNAFGNTNQENYGVNMTGQIWIPSDANRKGQYNDVVLFKDGIDDFTYLNIDGQVLLNDNDWTGYNSVDNLGGHVTAMNVSDPKYNDGEWVNFQMIMWEGGGGDAGVLYSDMEDTNGTFAGLTPGAFSTVVTMTGSAQVGTSLTDGAFGFNLANGPWAVSLTVENTGTSATFNQNVTVVPEPTAPLFIGLSALGAFLRRRRNR